MLGFGKDGKGVMIRDIYTITLGALAAQAAIKADNPLGLLEDFRTLKQEFFGHHGQGEAVDDNVIIGICSDDLTVAEIAEAMTIHGPLDKDGARIAEEKVERPVFPLYVFDNTTANKTIRDPNTHGPCERKLRWSFSNDGDLTWFAFNMGPGALTTGDVITLYVKYYGVWIQ